jgi:hypothetical protein
MVCQALARGIPDVMEMVLVQFWDSLLIALPRQSPTAS